MTGESALAPVVAQLKSALMRSESRFRRLVESNIIGVFTGDRTGRILDANDAFLKMHGYTSEDLQAGLVRWDRMTPAEFEHFNRRIGEQLSTIGVTSPVETERIRKDGMRVPVLLGLASLDDEGGQAIGFVLDLTKRKRAEGELLASQRRLEALVEELHRAKEAAETANLAKSEFLANMSHEIRTPMNGVLGMLELALDSGLNTEQHEYVATAKNAAESLLGILDQILDLSKIEAGRLVLDPVQFQLRECLSGVMNLLAARAQEKGIELACQVLDDVPDLLVADEMRMRQVLLNLIGNAIKFTQEGGVWLRVEMESIDDDAATLHFAVRDTGVGIPADKLKLIFDPFTQADSSTTRRFGGTGLGLTISSKLVKHMGGRMWVESKPSGGSCFHFTMLFGLAQ
jgi:PAS domain S-box-containing protein